MPALGGLGACPPGKFEKLYQIESEGIFSNLSTFNVPVDTGKENFLNVLSACLSMLGNVAEITTFLNSYSCAVTIPLKLLMPSLMLP